MKGTSRTKKNTKYIIKHGGTENTEEYKHELTISSP